MVLIFDFAKGDQGLRTASVTGTGGFFIVVGHRRYNWLFYQCVPLTAVTALTTPFSMKCSAGLTNKSSFGFSHVNFLRCAGYATKSSPKYTCLTRSFERISVGVPLAMTFPSETI